MKTITTSELKKLISAKAKFFLLDVRETNELGYGMIPLAKSVPLSELEHAFNLEPQTFKKRYGFDKPMKTDKIIIYCRTGGRSTQVTEYLDSIGYNAINYPGSVQEWSKTDKNVKMY